LPGELTGLRIQFLLDIEARLKYRQDEPALEIKMTRKGGEVLSYHFSKPEDASYYALKRSDLDHYFKVVEYTVAPVKETAGENLVQTRTDEASNGYCQVKGKAWAGCTECGITMADKFIQPPTTARF
jgi:hypothetical protein